MNASVLDQLPGCRVTLPHSFIYSTVHVLPGGVAGCVVLKEGVLLVYGVDGSRQYEWAWSKHEAARRAVEYRRPRWRQ